MKSLYGLNIDYKYNDKELIGANYPLKETLKSYLKKREILGGDKLETTGSRFDGLGVPLGLYLSNDHTHMLNNNKIINNNSTIDDGIFNKLLDNIQINKSKKNRKLMVTKKNNNYKKLTKKRR